VVRSEDEKGKKKTNSPPQELIAIKNVSEDSDAGDSRTGCRKRMTDILHGGRECMETMENIASVVFKATTV